LIHIDLEKALPYLPTNFPTTQIVFAILVSIVNIVGGSSAPSYNKVIVRDHHSRQSANPHLDEVAKNLSSK